MMVRAGADVSSPMRKRKLRKGTRSCTECRRRKLRCNGRSSDSPCGPCLSRGSQCIDQQDQAMDNRGVVSLPGAVSVGSIDDLLMHVNGDISESAREADTRAPFVEMLNAARKDLIPSVSPSGITKNDSHAASLEQRRLQKHNSLSKLLPEYETLVRVLSENGDWWSSFRQKTHVLSQSPCEDLQRFVTDAYNSSIPADLGMLLVAYARSSGENHSIYPAVESILFPDSYHAHSLEDLECLLLLAKAYSDVGLPRQAWHMYRKGIAISQGMGLNCRRSPPKQTAIWWAFYHGDRFMSMLLGLPYGFNDAHFGADTESLIAGPEFSEQRFVLRCAFVAGKVIDRNVVPTKPSSSCSLLLDEQMDAIASSMPESWWELPTDLPRTYTEINRLRDRLLQQFYFLHVRMILHLPFLFSASGNSLERVHGLSCLKASRLLLKRFVMLRSNVNGSSIFDCKTSDFVGFMGAVVLTLGWVHSVANDVLTPSSRTDDIALLSNARSIFRRQEIEKGCKISAQCRKTLELLCEHNNGEEHTQIRKIAIPFFGNITWNPAAMNQDPIPLPPLNLDGSTHLSEAAVMGNERLGVQTSGLDSGDLHDFESFAGINWTLDVVDQFLESDADMQILDLNQDWNTLWYNDG